MYKGLLEKILKITSYRYINNIKKEIRTNKDVVITIKKGNTIKVCQTDHIVETDKEIKILGLCRRKYSKSSIKKISMLKDDQKPIGLVFYIKEE